MQYEILTYPSKKMSTIRKRGDKWRMEIYKNSVRKSKTCSTKAEATLWGAEEEKKMGFQS